MSLFHEAYLFQPRDFARAVLPYVRAVTTSSHGYARLRADAIRLYDSNQQVRDLADEYGGWDRQGIMTAFPGCALLSRGEVDAALPGVSLVEPDVSDAQPRSSGR